MPSPNSTLEGIVLNSVETGESHIILSIFSKKNGLSKVLLRTRKSVRFNSPPDYFDDVELVLNFFTLFFGLSPGKSAAEKVTLPGGFGGLPPPIPAASL